jgi:two-component system, NarL family, nitrate/nitrite response regulator NarL
MGRASAALPARRRAGHDGTMSARPLDSNAALPALRVAVTVRDPRLRTRLLQALSLRPDIEVVPRAECEVAIASWDGPAGDAAAAVYLGDWDSPAAIPGHGPHAFLYHDADIDQVVAAARAVAAGLMVLDPELAARLGDPGAAGDRSAQTTGAAALTDREREVLALMAEGLPNKGIGRALGISEHTAKYHVAAILSKLDAQSRAEAVMLAARQGLVAL